MPAAITLARAQIAPPRPVPSLAGATAPTGGTSLREALDAAWALSPAARSADSRRAQLQARERAASSWINGSPSALLAQRSDRFNNNGGFSIDETRALVSLSTNDERDCAEARDIAKVHLDAIRTKLAELQKLERTLSNFVQTCTDQCLGGPAPKCTILKDLSSDEAKNPGSTRCCG